LRDEKIKQLKAGKKLRKFNNNRRKSTTKTKTKKRQRSGSGTKKNVEEEDEDSDRAQQLRQTRPRRKNARTVNKRVPDENDNFGVVNDEDNDENDMDEDEEMVLSIDHETAKRRVEAHKRNPGSKRPLLAQKFLKASGQIDSPSESGSASVAKRGMPKPRGLVVPITPGGIDDIVRTRFQPTPGFAGSNGVDAVDADLDDEVGQFEREHNNNPDYNELPASPPTSQPESMFDLPNILDNFQHPLRTPGPSRLSGLPTPSESGLIAIANAAASEDGSIIRRPVYPETPRREVRALRAQVQQLLEAQSKRQQCPDTPRREVIALKAQVQELQKIVQEQQNMIQERIRNLEERK
jgi:hypothetical protein